MKKTSGKDIGTSVRASLLRLARRRGEDFQLVLTRYANERLLFRLASSAHADRFVLKGALLFILWTGEPHRATRDLDLLGFGESGETHIRDVFAEVLELDVADDGVRFDLDTLKVGLIREEQEYGGELGHPVIALSGRSRTVNIVKPNRKKHGYAQHLNAPPEKVFPLLCPVREVDWAPGWMPETVISRSGVCEQDCIFITPPEMPSEPAKSIWLVTRYDPGNRALEMFKVAPEHTISRLEISLQGESDSSTTAHISYEITAIGPAGDTFMEAFTEEWYREFMVEWERAMNHYLETGTLIG